MHPATTETWSIDQNKMLFVFYLDVGADSYLAVPSETLFPCPKHHICSSFTPLPETSTQPAALHILTFLAVKFVLPAPIKLQ